MRDQQFHSWLQQERGHQNNSADSHVGRAKSCENYFGIDLDVAAHRRLIPDLIEQIYARKDLSENTKDSYASALRRYAEFYESDALIQA
jgi:hypothetical protein